MSRSSRLFSDVKNIFFYRLVRANDSLPGANDGKESWAHSI